MGEAHFIRAYCYFAMVKRYGGVPILREPQEYVGDIESLKVPRDTEKACYDFIAEDLDEAFRLLPDNEEIFGKRTCHQICCFGIEISRYAVCR